MIGTDPRTDLALIKVEGGNASPTSSSRTTSPRIGDWVLAVGNPFGLGGTVTAGIVSARGRDIGAGPYDDFIQIDAPVNKGNSGGPTFDIEGNVIGVNTAIFSPSGGSVGIAFAIPADTVKSVVAQLKDKGSVTRGWIGVQIQPVTPDIAESLGLKKPTGALVAEPQADGPAVKAGIEAGDVITAVNGEAGEGRPRSGQEDRRLAAGHQRQAHRPARRRGEDGQPDARRIAERREARADAKDRPEKKQQRAAPRPDARRRRGQRAGRRGHRGRSLGSGRRTRLRAGDVILEVAGKTVSTPADVRKALGGARDRRQAHRAAAREVGREHPLRRGAGRPRLRINGRAASGAEHRDWGVAPAIVAPAGGANPGDGCSPSRLIPASSPGIRRPRRGEGGWGAAERSAAPCFMWSTFPNESRTGADRPDVG